MEQSIKEYMDALYIKALSEAREKHKNEIIEANKEMAQRGLSQGFSGIAFGKMLLLLPGQIGVIFIDLDNFKVYLRADHLAGLVDV